MKTLSIFLLFMFFYLNIGQEKQTPMIDYEMINFKKAYEHIRKWEGNYSNLEHDSGGETYGGIARNYNKDWYGWIQLDSIKKQKNLEWNAYIPDIEYLVVHYYFTKWREENYNKINDPYLASYLFDYSNSGNIAIRHLKEILTNKGHNLDNNTILDIKTVNAINRTNSQSLINELKEVRKKYYFNVTIRNPNLEMYLKGWVNRAEGIIG